MADEKNRPQTPPAPRAPSPMEPIRVKALRSSGSNVNLPPPSKGGMIMAGPKATGETIEIQYEPWQRHHRVRELDHEGSTKTEVCIPESWVAYTPEERGA